MYESGRSQSTKVDCLKVPKLTVLKFWIVKVDGPEVRKWTILMYKKGRSKSAEEFLRVKIDGLKVWKWTDQNYLSLKILKG